jgi:uncharacterized membrane protein
MSAETMTTSESLRERALRRLKKQRDFRIHLLMYVMVNAFLVAVWAATGADFFWPIFPMVGWGVGVVANAYDAYGRDVPSESQINREMEKLRGDG